MGAELVTAISRRLLDPSPQKIRKRFRVRADDPLGRRSDTGWDGLVDGCQGAPCGRLPGVQNQNDLAYRKPERTRILDHGPHTPINIVPRQGQQNTQVLWAGSKSTKKLVRDLHFAPLFLLQIAVT